VAGSWNKEVRLYELGERGRTVGRAMIRHDQPVLCAAWSNDGTRVFTGSCDNTAKMWHLESKRDGVIAQHTAPIKECLWAEAIGCLVTGSWDKTVKFWDVRTPGPAKGTVSVGERVYCMDLKEQLLVVGTADRNMLIYDLRNPSKPFKTMPSPLKFQSRCVAAFPDMGGFALGSIEGRVAIQYIDEKKADRNFAFKCHRISPELHSNQVEKVFAVNAICFHPKFGTFATAGSDGCYTFWDKDTKQRLKLFPRNDNSITTCCFNRDGTVFAYALSYDWSKGIEHVPDKRKPHGIMLHSVLEEQVRPRPVKK